MLSSKLHSSIGNTDQLYVDDVFSAYTYTGNDSTQTINNGIDLAGKGGLVWTKEHKSYRDHSLFDTARGVTSKLLSNMTTGNYSAATEVTAFNSNGYSLGTSPQTNGTAQTYVSWTFRKAPKFFDVVTYTGNGTGNLVVPHGLTITPGMIVVKRVDSPSNWFTWHRGSGGNAFSAFQLNSTNSAFASASFTSGVNSTGFSVTAITDSDFASPNVSGASYVAYLFAHDTSAAGIVQCGSVTGAGAVSVELGWEPQFVLIKVTNDPSGGWHIFDTSRGMTVDNTLTGDAGNDKRLSANSISPEVPYSSIEPTATGFRYIEFGSPQTFIYLAIRRPNKPPTTGTEVYNAVAYTGNSTGSTKQTIAAGFPPDAVLIRTRRAGSGAIMFGDRLRGSGARLNTSSTATEAFQPAWFNYSDNMQFVVGPDPEFNPGYAGGNCVAYAFKRAPGVFDVVCYTGNGVQGNKTRSHNLGTAPELIITKQRTGSVRDWHVNSSFLGSSTHYLFLNRDAAQLNWGGAPCLHTASTYDMPGDTEFNQSLDTYVAYLFASLPGISKVGSYTGNGSSQTINCGFSTGARFVLIKRTDSTGDWYVWDTVRGIVSANDPHLSLNTTAAEVTTNDSVDPDSTGFIVNQVAATNINVTSATYLYLAIA